MKYKKLSVFDQKSLNPETVSLDTAVNNDMYTPLFEPEVDNYQILASELKPNTEITPYIFNLDDFDNIVPTTRNGWNSFTDIGEPNIKDLNISFDSISNNNKKLLKDLINAYNNEKAIYLKSPAVYNEAGVPAAFINYIIFNLTNGFYNATPSQDSDNTELYIFQFSSDNYTNIAKITPSVDSFKNKINTAFIHFEIKATFIIEDETKIIDDITEFKVVGDYNKNYIFNVKEYIMNNSHIFSLPIKHGEYDGSKSPLELTTARRNYINVNTKNEFANSDQGRMSDTYCGTMIAISDNPNGQEQLCIHDINSVNCLYYNQSEEDKYQPICKTLFNENYTTLTDLEGQYHRNFTRLYRNGYIASVINTKCDVNGTALYSPINMVDYTTVYHNSRIDSNGNVYTTLDLNISAEYIGNFLTYAAYITKYSDPALNHKDDAYFEPIIGVFNFNRYFPSKIRRTFDNNTVATYFTTATNILHAQSMGVAIKGHYYANGTYEEIPLTEDHRGWNQPRMPIGLQLNGMNGQTLIRNDTLTNYISTDSYYNKVTLNNQVFDTIPALLRADNIENLNMHRWIGNYNEHSTYTSCYDDPLFVNSIRIVGNLQVNCITPGSALKY